MICVPCGSDVCSASNAVEQNLRSAVKQAMRRRLRHEASDPVRNRAGNVWVEWIRYAIDQPKWPNTNMLTGD